MALISSIKQFYNKFDSAFSSDDLRIFANSLVSLDGVHCADLNEIVEPGNGLDLYLLYKDGEAVVWLVDRNGITDELADEEEFNDEPALWFSEFSHRVSPFWVAKQVTDAFMESCENCDLETPKKVLTVVSTNAYVINYDDYADEYRSMDGLLWHRINKMTIPIGSDRGYGQALTDNFRNDIESGEIELPKLESSHYGNPNRRGNDRDDKPVPTEIKPTITVKAGGSTSRFETMPLPDMDINGLPVTAMPCLVHPEHKLNNMVGLLEIRRNINEAIAFGKFAKKMQQLRPGSDWLSINLHTIMVGNPGTGKTTVAQYYASMLHKAGLLSEGHTIVATRTTFMGQNFGCEEERMRKCLTAARGGVLFIDEVGDLINHPHPHDPGKAVISLMLNLLADENMRDIAVVLALYNERDRERLYTLNPGIKSRFATVLTLPDYSVDELLTIVRRRVKAMGMTFTRHAWNKLTEQLRKAYRNKDQATWGNARSAITYLEKVLVSHAVRCEAQGTEGDDLLKIVARDIPLIQLAPKQPQRPRVGF